MRSSVLVASGAALLSLASPVVAACPSGTVGVITQRATAVRLSNKVVFRTSGLALDFDGSPRAYGVRDQGEENICAGLAPLEPPCRGQFRGACYEVCQRTFAEWSRSGGDPERLPRTMCSVGLGGSGCGRPDTRLQDPPRQDWFVSETSLKTSPPSGSVDAAWLRSQSAQLDPSEIRYLVAPAALTRKPWNVRFGDVGVAFEAKRRVPIPFIVGDGGGLGEGSVSLLSDLRPDKPPRLREARSALGEPVRRFVSGVTGDFRFIIFTGTAANAPAPGNVTLKTAADLPGWISETALATLRSRSSVEEVMACSGRVPAIAK